jgi:hypothetical protein
MRPVRGKDKRVDRGPAKCQIRRFSKGSQPEVRSRGFSQGLKRGVQPEIRVLSPEVSNRVLIKGLARGQYQGILVRNQPEVRIRGSNEGCSQRSGSGSLVIRR